MIQKKLLALLLALLLVGGLAACGKSDTGEDAGEAEGATRVVYDLPEGYVIVGSNNVGGGTYNTYGILDEDETPLQALGVAVVPMLEKENIKAAIDKKDVDLLEEWIDDHLEITFPEVAGQTVMRIDEMDDAGSLVEITYYLVASNNWLVMLVSDCLVEDLDAVNADMLSVMGTVKVEAFSFQGA